MDEKLLYASILCLSASWQVKFLSLNEKAGVVTVTIGVAGKTQLACPACDKSCPVHEHEYGKWCHPDTCWFTTLAGADIPRIMYPLHGCRTLPVL